MYCTTLNFNINISNINNKLMHTTFLLKTKKPLYWQKKKWRAIIYGNCKPTKIQRRLATVFHEKNLHQLLFQTESHAVSFVTIGSVVLFGFYEFTSYRRVYLFILQSSYKRSLNALAVLIFLIASNSVSQKSDITKDSCCWN